MPAHKVDGIASVLHTAMDGCTLQWRMTDIRISHLAVPTGPKMHRGMSRMTPCTSIPNIPNSSWGYPVHLCQRFALASHREFAVTTTFYALNEV